MNNEDFDVKTFTPQQARRWSGVTAKRIAERLDISYATYNNKESGKSKFYVEEAIKFAQIVGIPFENIKWE